MKSLPNDGLTINRRPVTESDYEFLLKVFASAREEELASAAGWSSAEKISFLSNQLAAQKADYDLRYPNSEHDVLLLDSEPVGQIWIWRDEKGIRLLDIALLPEYRRRGIGTILLKELQEEASASGKTLRHCVYKENHPARSFYSQLGFCQVEDLGMYYLMEWKSTSVPLQERK